MKTLLEKLADKIKQPSSTVRNRTKEYNTHPGVTKIRYITIEPDSGISIIHFTDDTTHIFQGDPTASSSVPHSTPLISTPLPIELLNNMSLQMSEVHELITSSSSTTTPIIINDDDDNSSSTNHSRRRNNNNDNHNNLPPALYSIINNLPKPTENSDRYVPKILGNIIEFADIMLDNNFNNLYPHPPSPTDPIQHVIDTYNSLSRLDDRTKNKKRFEAGYSIVMAASDTSWPSAVKNFVSQCKKYYTVMKFSISITEGAAWERKIKEELFRVKIDHSYYKEMNIQVHWPFMELEIRKHYRQILGRNQDSEEQVES